MLTKFMHDITKLGSFTHLLLYALLAAFISPLLGLRILTLAILVFVLIGAIRLAYFKDRPKKQSYNNLIEYIDASSFPSMHAARVTGMVVLLATINTETMYVTVPLGLLVMQSRIYLGKHDIIDISAGAFVGLLLGYLVTIAI